MGRREVGVRPRRLASAHRAFDGQCLCFPSEELRVGPGARCEGPASLVRDPRRRRGVTALFDSARRAGLEMGETPSAEKLGRFAHPRSAFVRQQWSAPVPPNPQTESHPRTSPNLPGSPFPPTAPGLRPAWCSA